MKWISVEDKKPGDYLTYVVMVKRKSGEVTKAYYHADNMAWLSFYSKEKRNYFQDKSTLKWLDDVTHWVECSEYSEE